MGCFRSTKSEKTLRDYDNEFNENLVYNATECEELTVDEFLLRIGQFGKKQKILVVFFCFLTIPSAFPALSMTFVGQDSPWTCVTWSTECNRTGVFSAGDGFYGERCTMNRSFWRYTYSKHISVITEWDLVCDKQLYSYLANSALFIGLLIGGFVWGMVSDRYGRKIVLFPCLALIIVSGFASAFAPNIWAFFVFRLLQGIGKGGTTVTVFVMATELVGPTYRGLVGSIPWYSNCLSLMALPMFAWLLMDWRHLQLTLSAPYFILIGAYSFVPESIRWLYVNGRTEEAHKILKQICKTNGTEFPNARLAQVKNENMSSYRDIFQPFSQCMSTMVQCFAWFTNALLYFGISLASKQISGNLYRDFLLMASVGLPAITLCIICCNKFGRKPTTISTMFFSGVLCVIIAFIPDKGSGTAMGWTRIGIAMVCKLLNALSFSAIFIWSAELFPTVMRSRGMAMITVFSRLGGMSAPWIAQVLSYNNQMLPFIIMGSVTVVASLICLVLKETLNIATRETMNDTESKQNDEMLEPQDDEFSA